MVLDLHGVKHQDVTGVFDTFVWEAMKNKEVEISVITGNSTSMKKKVQECIEEYGFSILPFEQNMGTIKIAIG